MPIPSPRPGSVALVTGASSGIGEELARELAARGHDLVLVARRADRLQALAAEIGAAHGRQAHVLPCDVTDPDARTRLFADVTALDVQVDVLALSAGFGLNGPFLDHDRERVRMLLRTNLEGLVDLTYLFATPMQQRRRGAILLVSSLAGNQPMPNFGIYAATKAAVTSFAQALGAELKPAGITVTALCPGGVRTEFSEAGQMQSAEDRQPSFMMATPGDTARAGLEALAAGRRKVTPGLGPRAFTFAGSHLPRAVWLPVCRRLLR